MCRKKIAVEKKDADLSWFLYDLKFDKEDISYKLACEDIIYTQFKPALKQIITPRPGELNDFVELLQHKLDEKLDGNPPDAPALGDVILS